jgi:hypothetical protein
MTDRTTLQRKADQIDCDLYRVLSRVESLYDEYKRHERHRTSIAKALSGLRSARVELRGLMHPTDRERT